ncbi:MAG: funZ protein [Candidatus Omnitrophica bacterium]|nr:funZ protein [Candidatus Omnitrophota bacterium]
MLPIAQLQLGFNDAKNYNRREYRDLFNQLFVKDESFEKLCNPTSSFLIGEKGTGKTAYSTFFTNISYQQHHASLHYIRETDYPKFISLKKDRQLNLSDYVNIWRVIICLMLAQQIRDTEKQMSILSKMSRFSQLEQVIDEYYMNAFSPEITSALQFVEHSKASAELLAKHLKLAGESQESNTFSETRFQVNLLFIERHFKEALRALKLRRNQLLFIDGVDLRPSSIPYNDYLECIKGLANAAWELNNDFFPSIKDSQGRLRVVLLLRPDIFQQLEMPNQNAKIRDNSVLLDWRTTDEGHRSSLLFEVSDRLLRFGQGKEIERGKAWDYYFPFDSPKTKRKFSVPSSFIEFLRLSYYRPRDIVTMLSILKESATGDGDLNKQQFSLSDLESPTFRRRFADYLLGEVKDHILFYYTLDDYSTFLRFFEFMQGQIRFAYNQYLAAFEKHAKSLSARNKTKPLFMDNPDDFLQFLYDLNVISYNERTDEGETYTRWCFQERTFANIAPKVMANETYQIHYGLARALNIGKALRRHN